MAKKKKSRKRKLIGKIIVRGLAILGTAAALFVILVFGLVSVISLGPSETAKGIFVNSVMGTSAAKFLARIYFSEEEIQKMISSEQEEASVEFDPNSLDLVKIKTDAERKEGVLPVDTPAAEQDPATITSDADGDGIEALEITGEGFTGNLLIVYDPARVHFYSISNFSTSGSGKKITTIINETGAVAAINGGGFYDPDGHGQGGMPIGPTFANGELVSNFDPDHYYTIIGLTGEHKLLVGNISASQALSNGIVEGITFGPALVQNGEAVEFAEIRGGLNPRSAIGQRADGAILLMTVNGRQPGSLGATYKQMGELMLKYGAVTAGNLDGGSSSRLFYRGEQLNKSSSLIGMRPVPNAIIVK